jgi:hypothetical protein
LIPHAQRGLSNLFTHIKGARTDHIIALRAHHAKKRDGLPDLTEDELKPHSAKHTLLFIENEYVEKDDDASHYTWGEILTATRMQRLVYSLGLIHSRSCHFDTVRPLIESRMVDKRK